MARIVAGVMARILARVMAYITCGLSRRSFVVWCGVIFPQHVSEHANHGEDDDASDDSEKFRCHKLLLIVYFKLREVCKAVKYMGHLRPI
jgi:hypothetical protein